MAISEWADMMPNTITVQAKSGVDAYNKPTFATGVGYSARVVYRDKLVTTADGREVVAKGVVYSTATSKISTEDKVTLPDTTSPQIVTSELYPDESGDSYCQFYFK